MEGKSSEINYVTNTLLANGYPPAVISNVSKKEKPSPESSPSPEESVGMFLIWLKINPSSGPAFLMFVGSRNP